MKGTQNPRKEIKGTKYKHGSDYKRITKASTKATKAKTTKQ